MGDQMVFIVVALGVIGLGLYFMLSKKGMDKGNEPVFVEATIVDLVTETDSSHSEGRGLTTTTSTYPVYEYELNGRTYRTQGMVGITVFTKDKYQVGATETIRVNPANPRRISTRGSENATATIGAILIAFGILLLFCLLL